MPKIFLSSVFVSIIAVSSLFFGLGEAQAELIGDCGAPKISTKKTVIFTYSKSDSWEATEGSLCLQVLESVEDVNFDALAPLFEYIGLNTTAITEYGDKIASREGLCGPEYLNSVVGVEKIANQILYVFEVEDEITCTELKQEIDENGAHEEPVDLKKNAPVRYKLKLPSALGDTLYLYFFKEIPYTPPKEEPGKCECERSLASDGDVSKPLEVINFIQSSSACADGSTTDPDTKENIQLKNCVWTPDPKDSKPETPPNSPGSSAGPKDKDPGTTVANTEAQYGTPAGYEGPLPDCAFKGSCRDVNKLLFVLIRFGEMTLGIIGTFAFVFFIYGGMTMILSMGNAEHVKKGRDILVSAVIGIIIAVSAYVFVQFMLDALGVSKEFIGIDPSASGVPASVVPAESSTKKPIPTTAPKATDKTADPDAGKSCECHAILKSSTTGVCSFDETVTYKIGDSVALSKILDDVVQCGIWSNPIEDAVKGNLISSGVHDPLQITGEGCKKFIYKGNETYAGATYDYDISCQVK